MTDTDEQDLAHAKYTRQTYGESGWLLSWARTPDGKWVARVSCPQYDETIEGEGPTRRAAINKASAQLLDRLHKDYKAIKKGTYT